jgi:hypothetical protein
MTPVATGRQDRHPINDNAPVCIRRRYEMGAERLIGMVVTLMRVDRRGTYWLHDSLTASNIVGQLRIMRVMVRSLSRHAKLPGLFRKVMRTSHDDI